VVSCWGWLEQVEVGISRYVHALFATVSHLVGNGGGITHLTKVSLQSATRWAPEFYIRLLVAGARAKMYRENFVADIDIQGNYCYIPLLCTVYISDRITTHLSGSHIRCIAPGQKKTHILCFMALVV
jgi:hypothetical protein